MRWIIYTSICFLHTANAARIVSVLGVPIPSHHNVFRPILSALAAKGHDVTLYTAIPDPKVNYKEVTIRNSFIAWENRTANQDGKSEEEMFQIRKDITRSPFIRDIGVSMMDYLLQDPAFKELLESDKKVDLLILASSFYQECMVALGHRFDAPIIDVHPSGNLLWVNWLHGSPVETSYMIDITMESNDEMDFSERLWNTVNFMITRIIWWFHYMPKYQEIIDKHLKYPGWETRPPITDMLWNISLVMINTSPILSYPYPKAPHIKNIGGINILPTQSLPQDIQDFMDKAENGVIYFSLGSHISAKNTLGKFTKEFVSAFSKIKQKVLWKWDGEVDNLPKNILIKKWFPQQSILAHKKLKLFISHGGFLSMTETMHYGVPIVGIPIIGDQQKNIVHMKKYEYGVHLDFKNLTEASISWAIHEILHNSKYADNAKRKSELLRDRPLSPLDSAVYWAEYVLRHKGAGHLHPTKLAWYKEALIDVYATITAAIIIPLYLCYVIVKYIFRCCKSIFSKKDSCINLKNKKNQ